MGNALVSQPKLEFEKDPPSGSMTEAELRPILEALIYVAEEPVTEAALASLLGADQELVRRVLARLIDHYQASESGIEIKQIANGYKMGTKVEHHEWVRKYIKHQTPPMKLSLAALETLAVISYKQPITVPEIQEIRGVNAVGVLKTLLEKKLITTAGRKNVIGRPILYKTTREFLVRFGLKNLDELPSLEEFEDLARSAAAVTAEPTGKATAHGIREDDEDRYLPLESEGELPMSPDRITDDEVNPSALNNADLQESQIPSSCSPASDPSLGKEEMAKANSQPGSQMVKSE
jgi:segregation and condensation protein B